MFRVIEIDMTDELYEIASCAMQVVDGLHGNLRFVNFVFPSPMLYSWELDFENGPMADKSIHGTVDTRAVTIRLDNWAYPSVRELACRDCETAYHITYGEHDFYYVPELCKVYVELEKPHGG